MSAQPDMLVRSSTVFYCGVLQARDMVRFFLASTGRKIPIKRQGK